ncbi:hypothetical protein EDC04DRAFT_2626334 [Pisolithus marmoratus]|nr:hypothetical protein EDC04DRAFT_2626334 [Pisolithus marmoratus]
MEVSRWCMSATALASFPPVAVSLSSASGAVAYSSGCLVDTVPIPFTSKFLSTCCTSMISILGSWCPVGILAQSFGVVMEPTLPGL